MIKKVVMVCVVVALVIALAGLTSGFQITSTSNSSTASAPKNIQFQSYTGPVVGSKNSNVYHYPSCYEAKKIKPENLVTFATIADACAAGYRPCKVCDPPACGAAQPTAAPTATPTAAPTSQQQRVTSPTQTSTPKPSIAAPTTASASASNVGQASAAASSSSTPGFEAVYTLGALAAVFLAISLKRRR